MSESPSTPPERAAIYLRSATGDSASLLRQEQACREAAAKHEPTLQIAEGQVFTDIGSSGTARNGPPGLASLLKRASEKPKPFDYVLVESSDRLGRNLTSVLTALDNLAHHNIGVHFVSMDLDSRALDFRNILLDGILYEYRLARLRGERVSQAHLAALSEGRAAGGRCFGYRNDPAYRLCEGKSTVCGAKQTVIREEAEIIREIFRDFANGRTTGEIARHLNDVGIPGPTGVPWNHASIRRILRNSRYRGTLVWNRTQRLRNPSTGRIVSRARPQEQVITVAAPELRIVEDELAARVDARMATL